MGKIKAALKPAKRSKTNQVNEGKANSPIAKTKNRIGYGKSESSGSQDSKDFEPIVHVSMTEAVEKRIREYLKNKNLRPGDPIPSETELSEQLEVSRNVIREALSRFRMLGLIQARRRRGMILTTPDIFSGLERVLDPHLLGEDTIKDIFGLRLVIEMGMADLLFMHKTDEDVAVLEQMVKKKEHNGNASFKLGHEVAFHGKLYEITGNHTLQRFQKLLLPIFQYVIDIKSHSKYPRKVGTVSHQELVEILKKGNPAKFRNGMYEHLKPHFEWVNKPKK